MNMCISTCMILCMSKGMAMCMICGDDCEHKSGHHDVHGSVCVCVNHSLAHPHGIPDSVMVPSTPPAVLLADCHCHLSA